MQFDTEYQITIDFEALKDPLVANNFPDFTDRHAKAPFNLSPARIASIALSDA